jgi:glycosyltransferase involved in cell wall biosynthesis
VVVFSGSFRPWHGADTLVRCAAKLPDVFFLFVGDGPRLGEAIALASELGVSERMLFAGRVPYDEVPAYLKWADVGVAPYQPARLEQMKLGFFWSPLKIFEYMAMGLPVVSLDVAPLRAIVRESEGTLVSEGDIDGMVEAIRALVDDTVSAREKGRAARERVVAEFSWKRHCEGLERILLRLLAQNNAS